MSKRDEATLRQIMAARPDRSTWLSANAGSGKTRVLTDRVARLLLDGVNPQNILCLTYTKAAASEMQNRLFRRLGDWAMRPDAELRAALLDLGVEGALSDDMLRQARRLFASAIETPGGLKIQTIHSFCALLLRRFPMEAGVSPQFSEIDERSAALLQRDVLEELSEGDQAAAVGAMAAQLSGENFDALLGQILRWRELFAGDADPAALAQAFGAKEVVDLQTVCNSVFLGDEADILAELLPVLRASGSNDQKAADRLDGLVPGAPSALPVLEAVFLTGTGAKVPFAAKIDSFPAKAARQANPDLMTRLEPFMRRVEAARQPRLIAEAYGRTEVLHRFARAFLGAYEAAKARLGWLDFDDLIAKAHQLLTNPAVAAWVLFRLDGGIDHILVDEAQDTSPLQWKVIERLAQEFTSGQGARAEVTRTIFVVGDKKQSIYSFQGADPREFDRMRQDFAARLSATGGDLQDMQMAYSFRSSQAILSVVDATFAGADASGFTPGQDHLAFHSALPGRVDLWPVIDAAEVADAPDWHDPVDYPAANDPEIELAEQIARHIKELIDTGQPVPGPKQADGSYAMRPVTAGDFLILVQRRKLLFQEIIAACKRLDLPVAGADRLKVAGELAVRDIGALLSFLATPEDNLSLAAALRSPLFGWTEPQLYGLAQGRAQPYLWRELRERREEFADTMAVLDDLRKHADLLRPFELIERILTRHGGRRRLLARLGAEAEDGIDALLSQAMLYEQKSVDSLTGFLVWLQTDDMEIKRQMDEAGDQVRVMTVHGAKGLEAPIVILPETATRRPSDRGQMLPVGDQILWKPPQDDAPATIRAALDTAKEAEKAERDRLLYVAMTRAESWLIVAAAKDVGKAPEDSWYGQVQAGMQMVGAQPLRHPTGTGLRFEQGDWGAPVAGADAAGAVTLESLPACFLQSAVMPALPQMTLSPSDLGGAKALPGEAGQDQDAAKRRGRQVHKLLEVLPLVPALERQRAAEVMLSGGTDAAAGSELASIMAEVSAVLDAPHLAPFFTADALAEVPVSAALPSLGGRRIHGVIDRLILSDRQVLAVDFKSNGVVPEHADEVPEGFLRQMGAYAEALGIIYPAHEIRVALLWTRTATLMPLTHEHVIAALKRAAIT